jgi:hypothetical protein
VQGVTLTRTDQKQHFFFEVLFFGERMLAKKKRATNVLSIDCYAQYNVFHFIFHSKFLSCGSSWFEQAPAPLLHPFFCISKLLLISVGGERSRQWGEQCRVNGGNDHTYLLSLSLVPSHAVQFNLLRILFSAFNFENGIDRP